MRCCALIVGKSVFVISVIASSLSAPETLISIAYFRFLPNTHNQMNAASSIRDDCCHGIWSYELKIGDNIVSRLRWMRKRKIAVD
jgi:hypothetical protein